MKKFGIAVLLMMVAVVGIWYSAVAKPPHYIGDTVAQNRPNLVIDPMLEMARGQVAGITTINKFGRNFEIDVSTADIWDKGEAGATLIYIAPTVATGAQPHTIVSDDATDVTSSEELILTGQPANTQTVTIGTKVYTFLAVIAAGDGNVLISGVNPEGTIDNLVAAVNLAAGVGVTYGTGTTANDANVIAVKTAADDCTIYTVAATAIALAETMDNATWTAGAVLTVVGTGAHTLRIYGLKSWDTKQVSEDINMRGLSSVTTANSYVLIHRMKVLTKGATQVNAGAIDATSATDGGISARIRVNQGQTQMAIYGVPSIQTAYIFMVYASVNKTSTNAGLVDLALLVNPEPQTEEKMFLVKHTFGLQTVGTNAYTHRYGIPKKVEGPAIIKMQCLSGTNTQDISAGFDLVLVDN